MNKEKLARNKNCPFITGKGSCSQLALYHPECCDKEGKLNCMPIDALCEKDDLTVAYLKGVEDGKEKVKEKPEMIGNPDIGFGGFINCGKPLKQPSKGEIEELDEELINELEDELLGDKLMKEGLKKLNECIQAINEIRGLNQEKVC